MGLPIHWHSLPTAVYEHGLPDISNCYDLHPYVVLRMLHTSFIS